MLLYHGTDLESAKKLLDKKYPKIGTLKNSLGWTINMTNNMKEAMSHAVRKKRTNKKNNIGAILEFDIDDGLNNFEDKFINDDNEYWYNVYNKNHLEMITIHLSDDFDVNLLYDFDKISFVKAIKIL